jgi:hypothetical protein
VKRTHWKRWSACSLAIALLSSGCGKGDDRHLVMDSGYVLRGTVRDSASVGPLAGAVVGRLDPDLISGDTTGVDGNYAVVGLGGIPRGQLEVSRTGYRSRTLVMPDGATRISGPPHNEWALDVSLGVLHERSASVASDGGDTR